MDRDSGSPIAGFFVDAGLFQSEPSGADGAFTIAGLDPGDYTLEIDPPTSGKISFGAGKPDATGYLPTFFPGMPRPGMAAPVTLAAGESRDIEMRIQKQKWPSRMSILRPTSISSPTPSTGGSTIPKRVPDRCALPAFRRGVLLRPDRSASAWICSDVR